MTSQNTDSDLQLATLESALGVTVDGDESARLDLVVTTLASRIDEWEQMTPSELMGRDHELIETLFRISDKASMSAFMNDGRLPSCWWARLVIRLDRNGLYDRLTDQIHRETQAQFAKEFLRDERSIGGRRRAAKDPRSIAKQGAFALWQERRAGRHPKLRTNEQFATECMRRWPDLTSAKVILGWCTLWNRQARESQSAS